MTKREAGATIIEFVVVFPVLILIFFGIINTTLNLSDRKLSDFVFHNLSRKLSTGTLPVGYDYCSPNSLKEYLLNGIQISGQPNKVFLGLADLKVKNSLENDENINFCRSEYFGYDYLKITPNIKLDCMICSMGIPGFQVLAELSQPFITLIEPASPLLNCSTTQLPLC